MNGKIEEDTLERMEEIRGKPIRRGLDKAINECLDLLEDNTVTTDEQDKVTKVETCDRLEELVKNG